MIKYNGWDSRVQRQRLSSPLTSAENGNLTSILTRRESYSSLRQSLEAKIVSLSNYLLKIWKFSIGDVFPDLIMIVSLRKS